MNVSGQNSRVWLWQLLTWDPISKQDKKITEKELTLDVTVPAKVRSLILTTHGSQLQKAASQGDHVQVYCSIDNGNPPVTVRLLDRHGTELQTQKSSGKAGTVDLEYDFPNVSCDHAGNITCEAKGGESKTTTLLVRCPPMFVGGDIQYVTIVDAQADVSFNIRTHSHEMTGCIMVPHRGKQWDCMSSLTVTGSPPDLTVSVWLDNISKRNQGTWLLTLTNDVGFGLIDFTVGTEAAEFAAVTSASSLAETDGKEKTDVADVSDPQSVTKFIAIVVAVVVVVGIISVSVSVTVICLKKGSGSKRRQAVREEESEHAWPALPDPENGSGSSAESGQTSNTYQEIPDDPESVPLAIVRPTRHCRAPREDPDGYLHASPSLPDISGIRVRGLAQASHPRQLSHPSRHQESPPEQKPIYENCTNSL